ncbi:MAG TPA: hypothetical protein VE685_03455, partial [Thermoanaerobaculia bacterium]|nr:hypothetical protein [Thermoanaerobaculia bacterium]
RSALRFLMAVVIVVLLFPKVSMAGGPVVSGPMRPIEAEASRRGGEAGTLARLLVLIREVFRDQAEDETCPSDRCAKEGSENRMGIDPNGNS